MAAAQAVCLSNPGHKTGQFSGELDELLRQTVNIVYVSLKVYLLDL